MDGIEADGKLANFLRDAMAQIFGEMGKTAFDPLGDSSPVVSHQHSSRKQSQYERDQGVSREMNPVPDFRRGYGRKRTQLRGKKIAATIRTVKPPTSKIRSTAQTATWEAKGRFSRRAIRYGRINSPARPSRGESGESDHGRWDQSEDGRLLAHGSKKDFPSNRAQEIGEVDERDAVKNVAPIQSVLKEPSPVEVPPGAELEINQHGQHDEDNRVRCVFFFIHSVRSQQRGALVVEHGPT